MADPLDTIAAAIAARGEMTALGCPCAVGKLEVERLGEYPRCVFVSEGGKIDAVDDVGGRESGTDRTRQIRTDAMDVQVHIWGEDRENARDLMHAVVAASWALYYGSVSFGSYRWVTEQVQRGEHATHGSKILLSATWRLPVLEDPGAMATIAAHGHSTAFVSDLDGSSEVICT